MASLFGMASLESAEDRAEALRSDFRTVADETVSDRDAPFAPDHDLALRSRTGPRFGRNGREIAAKPDAVKLAGVSSATRRARPETGPKSAGIRLVATLKQQNEAFVWHDPQLPVAIVDALLSVAGTPVVAAVLSALARPPSEPVKDPRRPTREANRRSRRRGRDET